MTILRSPAAAHPPSEPAPDVARLVKDGRKAKRALRRRMKPTQQRCSERMLGPVIDQQCRELPKLPRGGDGRAVVSLRPSLGPRVSTEGVDTRPATASSLQNEAGSLQPSGSIQAEGHLSAPSSPAPPMAVGDDSDVPCEQREQERPVYPLRPVGGKERARQPYTNAGQRTIRTRGRSTAHDEETDGYTEKAEWQEMSREQDNFQRQTLQGDDNEFSSHLHLHTPPERTIEGEEDAFSLPMEGEDEGRSATMVLSSTVLLSPRGRARTPTTRTAPADCAYFPGGAPDRRTDNQDCVEDWAFSLSPRPHTAQGISRPEWPKEAAAPSFNLNIDQPRRSPDTGIRHHVTSMDHAALIEDLWAQGGVACENGRPAEERNRLACIAFGTDEFAGDREVACFLASAAAAAAAETAATVVAESLAAATATGSLVGGMAAPKALDRWSLLPPEAAVTLVAVPIHAGNPSCRYNPYHLKIVGREVDGGGERRTVEIMERESDDSQDAFGFREDENLPEEPLPREEDPSGLNDDGDGERGNQELGQADESSTFGVAKGGESVERAWFSLKGVTYVNVHGETHFQPLEEWRLEKERFDTLCRMKFVRSFPAWKYLRAIASFVVTKRVERLRQNIGRDLAVLDPACSSAVHEVVLQLERIQSIRFLTAVKGATVTYMLDDFFEEQTRNIVECQRELMDIYDRCGQILGRAAKKHLEAEGLLVTNRAWNQMPSTERARMVASQDTGAPTSGDVVSTTGAIGRPSLEEVRLSTVGQEPTRTATAVDGEDIADTVPTSWSFAARQRSECARIARVFRYARHRMRQELRGLALDHAELLLGAVTRTVVTIAAMRASPAASGVPSVPPGETSRGNISQEHPQMEDDVYDLEGVGDDLEDKIPPASEINGQGGTQKTMRRGGRNLRHEARPQATWNKRWAIAVDEDSMGDLSTLALDESMLEGGVDAGLEDKVGVEADTLVEWRKAFRQRVLSTGGKRHQMERSTNRRFDSRISLPENCLSLTRAIQLACELVPHAEETLAVTNPLGAKPVIIEMFEAEITPNLRGVDFFPITHRFHGEQNGMTEDVFVSAMLKLNAVCLGGIDAQLSEVSSDWEESDEEEHGEVTATGDKKDSQHEPTRLCNEKSVGGNLPSVLDARAWDPSVGEALPLTVAAGTEEPQGGLGRREWSRTKSERPSEICGTSAGPCEGISFEVEIGGIFQEWDLQVFPPLQDFVDRARHAQLQVLNALARVPCLLEHPEVKPYQAMAEGYGLGFDLPQGGTDGVLEGGEPSTSWDWGERGTIPETTYKMQEMEEGVDVFLPDCDWLDTLSEDPYYRGLQDKVFLSLASSHNAVYRMVGGLRPLLEEFQALGGFATQREARYERLQYIADPDAIAAKLIASGGREGTGAGSLDLTPVLLAKSTTEWLRDWYSRFERYRQKVRDSSTSCPQVLLSVNVTNLMAYLLALPETSLEEIRLIGPRLMLNSMKTLGAVFRRCNAILSGGLEGVDALGEKAGFLVQIEHWLWQLRDEVKKLHELGSLLKNIGCFRTRPSLPSVVRPRSSPNSSPVPMLTSMGERPPQLMSAEAAPCSETNVGGENENQAITSDLAGTRQDEGMAANVDKNVAFGGFTADSGRRISEQGASIDFRTVEHQVREGLESLEFHLAVLQRSVDHAHINMRIASQEFSSLLKKALESLAREIDRLEADILDPAFSSAATDPTKACSRLEAYRHRLLDLQEEESRYRHYNQLVDNDLATTGGKGAAKQQFDEEKMVLDLERVGTKRKQLVLKWAAQRKVCNIRQEWYNSRLISSDVEVMTGQLVQARQAHTFAVTTAGADEVTASCEATLAHLGRVVEAVGFLHNRNLTGAYWERVDQTMPLREDLKASARNESMATLRRAAGLEAIPAATLRAAAIVPSESARQSTAAEGGAVTISSSLAADGAAMAGQDGEKSATSSGNVGKCTVIKGIKNVAKSIDENPPDLEGSGNADLVRTEVAASRRTETVKDQPDVGASNDVSSVATRTLRAKPSDGKSRVGKAAAVVSSVAGRGRREEARRRAELYEVFPMAAEWGGVSLAMLLDHGLLERRKKIGSISAEATATAVLRNTLEELRGVWETAPMMFMWRFLEGPPAPGNINQELHVDPDSKHRRRLYSRVLAEPALATRGYSAGGIDGGIGGGGGGGGQRGETSHPATEGYTSLLSNGDELLRLAEHCRVVVDNVVDAPPALLAMGNIGKAALEWQKRISWFQELITHWMAVQEQWVRLAPAFVPPDLDVGVPAHQRVRFTDLSGSFHSILGLLRADDLMNGLSGKYQGVEKGGRSLLARVCKLQEDLEVISLAMDRWLSSCTVECPRLLSLPRHQLFRLYRDWAAGRVGSGEAAGETNERVSYMFRGVGEIIWKEIVSTTGGMTVRIHLAAVGVRSSGAGLEEVPFSSPVVAVGRFEIWVKNIDRKLMSAIAHDVETATVAVRQHGKAGGAPGCSTLLLASTTGPIAGGSRKVSTSGQPRSEVLPSSNQPTAAAEAAVLERSQPSLQARLLARSAHWTAAVEEALAGTALRTSPLPPDGGRSSRGGETSDARRKPETMLEEILSSIHLQVNSWTEELCQPGGMTVYNSVSTTALTTQALQQRDVLEELLKTTVPSLSATAGSAVQSERFLTTSAAADDAPSSLPTESPSAPSSPIVGDEQRPTFGELAAFSPFIWTCHLRHYYTPPVEALNQTGRTHQGNSNNGRGNGQEQEMVHSPPPPLIRVGIGPWNIPYGFEYAGTLERLWLTPLSERCLLHAVHSGKGRYGGLLVSASGNLRRPQGEGVGVPASSLPSPADISTVAQDVAVAFGRPFRMLQSSCVTSPQAVSSVIASTLVAGGVTVFAGVEELPKVSLAVLAESMRAVLLCLHARQEKVLVNGEEVPLSPRPHLSPNFDPILHQWKLLPWGSNNGGGGGGGGPFLGFFATLAKQGPAPQLPLAVRSTFRPVVTALPNTTLLLEAMLLTNGFLGARALVQGVVHGLRKLEDITATDRVHDQGEAVSSGGGSSIAAGTVPTARAVRPVLPPIGVDGNIVSGRIFSKVWASVDAATILQNVAVKAVRIAAEFLGPETARELRAARRKLGLASLTSSERKEKTRHISRAVEARVLIAGFARVLLFEETGGDVRALKSQKTKKTTSSSSGNASPATAAFANGAPTATGDAPKDAGQLEIDARRALIVSTFQQTEILREILKPLEDMAGTGRKLAQQSVKSRATELAESGTATRSQDFAQLKMIVKRALLVSGMSPTTDQIDAASELWQALWSCSRPAVIITGATGVGKSSILQAMPKMAEHVGLLNRKLNKSLKKLVPQAKKTNQSKVDEHIAVGKGDRKSDSPAKQASASPSDHPGVVFEPPANQRGAAPYRRILNRQVPFLTYVNATGCFRTTSKKSLPDGGTVASESSGSSKGTKATNVSDTSNVSGADSDGGASVFSQRSAASKSSSATGKSGASGGTAAGKSGLSGIPRAAIEGSAFVIPAQEIEVVHTGGCSAEHLIGSTDDKGSWLDGLLLRRLRDLVEGVPGNGHAGGARSRHRPCGVGTGDVCPPLAGKATNGFSHGCKSRLLVLDGPVSRWLEGMIAGDHAGAPALTGPQECGNSPRCLLLPNGEPLSLDAWSHVAVETGDVRHLSPSTITGVAVVHLRADGPALIKGMREAWLKKLSRRKFQHPGAAGGVLRPILVTTVSEFLRQEGFAEGGCCLEDIGDATITDSAENCTPASTCASRMRGMLFLLEGLLDILIDTDENAVVWEPATRSDSKPDKSSKGAATSKPLSKSWAKPSLGIRAAISFGRQVIPRSEPPGGQPAAGDGVDETSVGQSVGAPPSLIATAANDPPDEAAATTTEEQQPLVPSAITRQNELTPAEVQDIEKRLRVTTFLLCVYASIWGMGGHLAGEASRVMCSAYVRQSSPLELRQHIRESNLFDFVVDIRRGKLMPIGDDAGTCPGALPRGMWTLDPHWAIQASELSCPLPPALVIPSPRLSTVATAVYKLLGMDNARVLVEGPSGAGKTVVLSHLLKIMGKGIPDIVAGQCNGSEGSCTTNGGKASSLLEAGSRTDEGHLTEHDRAHDDAISEEEGEKKADAGVDERIRILDRAKRWMADAGAKAAVACSEAKAAMESNATRQVDAEGDTHEHPAEAAGVQGNPTSSDEKAVHEHVLSLSQRGRCTLPRSTVYLSMRRQATTNDIEGVLGRALKREKDGVLEAPQQSTAVIFLDDVHLAQEPRGEGCGDSKCMANSCAAETIRGMIDGYTPLGEIRVSSTAQRIAKEEGRGGGDWEERGAAAVGAGLPRLRQVHPDFAPRVPCGPGGDSFRRPSSAAVLAARTTTSSGKSRCSLHGTALGSGVAASSSAVPARPQKSEAVIGAGLGARMVPTLSTLPGSSPNEQQGHPTVPSSYAPPTDRLWRRFFRLALDSPSTSELRTVFSRACGDAFAGDGPISSALRGRVCCSSSKAKDKSAVLMTSEVQKAVDAMGGVAAEFPYRLHQLLMKQTSMLTTSRTEHYRSANTADPGVELTASRLDYFTLGRLLRPLFLGRTGNISTAAAVQQFFCHEIMREIVEPLRESWQRELATFELARLIRERALDVGVGVEADEERHIIETWLPAGTETPPAWTNARGLLMVVAYGEQQATKAIMASKTAADEPGSKGGIGGSNRSCDASVSYLEIFAKKDDGDMSQENTIHTRSKGKDCTVRTMVAHGVLMNTRDVFSPRAITKHLARAIEMLHVPWPARPDARPLVTPQDATNICKCLRQLSLPSSPLVVVRSEDRGMSREGGPESAFRLACALEGAGVVVMDAGTGLLGTKIESLNGATPPEEESLLSLKAVLRKAVLMCMGKGSRGPYLERAGDAGEDLWLNPGHCLGSKPCVTHHPQVTTLRKPSRLEGAGDLMAGPLVATKTVLLVKGAANIWEGGNGGWALRAIMDLVENGDVRRLFSDGELLKLVAAEEEHERRAMTGTHKPGSQGNVNHTSRDPADGTAGIGRPGSTEEAPSLGESGPGGPGSPTSSKDEILRWSCWTRGGTDFVYRRVVSYIRQSLTVALCLDDDEVVELCPSFPTLSTCPSVRLEPWSRRSMQLAASRSLSVQLGRPHRIATVDTATRSNAVAIGQEERLATGGAGSAATANTRIPVDEGSRPWLDVPDKGGVCLWPGATHAHLVGALAFGRFQSTVTAFKDPPVSSVSSSLEDDGGQAIELIKQDVNRVIAESERLFDAWMVLAEPSCCVEVFQAVEACGGGDSGLNRVGGSSGAQGQPSRSVLKTICFRAMAEEGRGPRAASLDDVLLLFKHICRLGCRRILERAHTLRRALGAANVWGVHKAHREVEKAQLKKRAKDVLDALGDNNQQTKRVQQEKMKVQDFWSEQSKSTREQRQQQYIRTEEVEKALLPIKASYETSRDSLSTLQEEDMEFLCTLCLGAGVLSLAAGTRSNVDEATQQRKQKGLHPELPFIVETVAVMLGNMSGYPQWIGEWVRLKASPSAKIIRTLLLDPAIVDRLRSFDPESEAGRKVAKVVIDKITERVVDASKKNISDGIASSRSLSTEEGGGSGDAGGDGTESPSADTPATQFARQIPLLHLKMESRAGGLLAAWVRDTIILVDALTRAEDTRAEIQADAKATRQEEERIRVENANEVRPLDEELALRVALKSRLSTRQRTIHHRSDLIKELGIMGGAIEDFAATCRQELHDLATAAEFFAGDALCFANVACLAAHLPYTIRTIALNRARNALQKHGVPVSQPCFVGDNGRLDGDEPASTPTKDNGPDNAQWSSNASTATEALKLDRFRLGNFATGVLTNLMQLHRWAYPTDTAIDDDDSGDESDGDRVRGSSVGDGLPFHPAFMDAAMLTLSTPKWPLLLDPEDIALRWLRRVYPGQTRLDAPLPASMVSMEVIAECAGKGEILPVCFAEGGVHSDLAVFLAADVLPIGAGGDERATICQQDGGKRGCNGIDADGGAGSDGFVVIAVDPQSSYTIVLKPGFRLILFESSSFVASFSTCPSTSSSLLFLQNSPEALARIQLVRFGGVDCVGVTASDDGVNCPLSTDGDMESVNVRDDNLGSAQGGDAMSASSSDEGSSSNESKEAQDAPVPAYVLAGMGLISQPGFEMSKTMGARLQEEFARAVPLGSGVDAAEQQQTGEAAASIVVAQRGALAYSRELSAAHEAVIALLAARPPCFNRERPPCAPDMAVPSGGEPTTGVSDEVERDQNRVLNNLIETLFAYKGILEKGLDIVPKCDRASQAKHAIAARKAEKVARTLTSSALRFLAQSSDMMHVSGLDPVFYSPVFPGVRALIQGAIRKAVDVIGSQMQNGWQALERAVVVSLTRSMVTRVADDFKWILPLAALSLTSPGDLPANGWWYTYIALASDRYGKINEASGSTSRLKLAKLFKIVIKANTGADGGLEKEKPKQERSPGDDQEGLETCTDQKAQQIGVVNPGLQQVRNVVGLWLEFDEAEVPTLTEDSGNGQECVNDCSDDDDDTDITRQGVKLSPQQWDLGFDTSDWARDRGATAVAALARDRGIPMKVKADVEKTSTREDDERGSNAFCSTLSQLWLTATTDRGRMDVFQAAEAKAFSSDDVLRRLVLMETTMNSVFARLPGYVLCEARRWVEWIDEVRRSLSAIEEGGNSTAICWLRFLLSHPPPAFESKRTMRKDSSSTSSSSSSSSSDEDTDGGDGSSSSSNGSGGGEDNAKGNPTSDSPDASPSATGVGSQSLAAAGELKPLEALAPHNKVRRDSRERMKIKLGLLDELGMAVDAEEDKNGTSAEAKEEFDAKARNLFRISTSQTRRVASAKKLPSLARETTGNKERSRSDPADKAAKEKMMTPKSSPSANIHEEDDANDEEEDCRFITFVAESFRPQRDNSDWHREVKTDPVPPVTPSDTPSDITHAMADQGLTASPDNIITAVDKPANEPAASRDDTTDTIDTGQQLKSRPTSSPQNLPDGTSDSDSSSEAIQDNFAIETALTGHTLDMPTGEVAKNDGLRSKSKQGAMSRWDDLSNARRAGQFQNTPAARIVAFSTMRSVKTRRRQHQLEVRTEELGCWSQRWNESPLIGIVLLLALAPDEHLAAKSAAACLMAEGGRDNLDGSIPWREVRREAVLGDLHKGCLESALEVSHRRAPVVVMAPANGSFCDPISRHFVSVLSHIERAARKAGTSVTLHDASKPAHVLLGRGVLVAQARRVQKGHARPRGGGNHFTEIDRGGPAMANMTHSAWEVCLKAAADGGWVVFQEFEGAADLISLIIDGIHRRSAVRNASTAAAEGQEKLLREQQVAGKVTSASNTMPQSRDGSIDSSLAPQGTPSNRVTVSAHQVGGPGGTADVPTAARKDCVTRRVAIPGAAGKKRDSASKMSPEHPLFKALSAGEGGAMSTRAQPDATVAQRRPLPEPHKNFRIILLSTASPEIRERDAGRSFGVGESDVVWWRPAPASLFQAAAHTATSKGPARDNSITLALCRDEIVHELGSNATTIDCGELVSAGVESISESCARYMQGGANGRKVIDNGAAINMHLAASLFVLCQADAAGESTVSAETPSRNTFSPPSASSPSDFSQAQERWPKEDAGDGTNPTLPIQHKEMLAYVVDEAVRASVVATELSDAPMVDHVAGVLDAEAAHLRKERIGDIVTPKFK